MKILVVGGAGYIGSHTVYQLIRDGHDVTIYDNLSTGTKKAVHPEAKLVIGDLLDKNALNALFSENVYDIVMHFAAKIVVSESVERPLKYYENNVYGVVCLLEAMVKHGSKNFMFSSTAAVYGEPDVQTPLIETDTTAPINPYGSSKKMAEQIIMDTHIAHGLNYVIFRYFNVAGADESGNIGLSPKTPLTHLIPIINEAALGMREKMFVFGNDYATEDGTCIRDYIHVTDLADAHVLGAKYLFEKEENQIINLGSKTGFSVQEVIDEAEKVLSTSVPHEIKERRAGDPAKLVASNDKASQLLDWKPKYSLGDMILSDNNWRKNPKY